MRDPQYFSEEEQQASEPTQREERLMETIATLHARVGELESELAVERGRRDSKDAS